MYSKVNTAILTGIDSRIIGVETDISEGMPMFSMVGFLSSEVKEARERVRTALKNIGLHLPVKRITVNMSPASIKKSGTGFDLPMAVSILKAMEIIKGDTKDMVFAAELGLNGDLHPLRGALSMVLAARQEGIKTCILARENVREARLVPDMEIIGLNSLKDVILYLNEGIYEEEEILNESLQIDPGYTDFSEINGMPFLRRACEVAVSGMHNLLLVGPPGSGKTFISKALPGIMPPLDSDEQLEISKIYSVCGLFGSRKSLINKRPFRSPHHTISDVGLTGGGSSPRPGEISLAHKGILFLDEMLEFKRSTIEVLRQPLEDGKVSIVRAAGEYTYPADFMLVCAMNPCPCGYYPDNKCRCTPKQINAYLSKLSRPLIDRIDICVEVPAVLCDDIMDKRQNESSKEISERVIRVQDRQKARFKKEGISFNSQMSSKMVEEYCKIHGQEKEFIRKNFEKLNLTARSYHKLLKVARTIADMEGAEDINMEHLREAICYRMSEGEGVYA